MFTTKDPCSAIKFRAQKLMSFVGEKKICTRKSILCHKIDKLENIDASNKQSSYCLSVKCVCVCFLRGVLFSFVLKVNKVNKIIYNINTPNKTNIKSTKYNQFKYAVFNIIGHVVFFL